MNYLLAELAICYFEQGLTTFEFAKKEVQLHCPELEIELIAADELCQS